MRALAVLAGAPAVITIEGTITVLLAGAASGAIAGAIYRGLMTLLPGRQLLRDLAFVVLLAALTLRGVHPVRPLPLALFGAVTALFAIVVIATLRRMDVERRPASVRRAAGCIGFLAVAGCPVLGAA